MENEKRLGLLMLILVLAIAGAIRLPIVLFERPIGRDVTEYANIAEHLRGGRGLTLYIKAFHATPGPVRHYSGADRAPMFPLMLGAYGTLTGPEWAGRTIGPLVFLLLLAIAFDGVRCHHGPRAAFWVALLLALHPGLLEVTLLPLTEAPTLLFISAALWGFFRWKSPALTGTACALAFLTRPNTILFALVFCLVYLARGFRGRAARDPSIFLIAALSGPAALAGLNAVHDAPATLLPQSFLLRVVNFSDATHYRNEGAVHETVGALLGDVGTGAVLRLMLKNAFYYTKGLLEGGSGLGYLVALAPLAALGFASRGRLRAGMVFPVIALINFLFFSFVWSTFDRLRFMSVTTLMGVFWIGLGVWLWLTEILNDRTATIRRSAIPLVFLTISALWSFDDVHRGYVAWREAGLGRPYSNNLEAVWDRDDVKQMREVAGELTADGRIGEDTVIASNEPWLTHTLFRTPAVLTPYDLASEEWVPFLAGHEAQFLLIHGADWPSERGANLEELREELETKRWTKIVEAGELELWERP